MNRSAEPPASPTGAAGVFSPGARRSRLCARPRCSGAGPQERRYTVAFANLTEEPGVTLEGTGLHRAATSARASTLAARRYPIDLVFYDNQRDDARALRQCRRRDRQARGSLHPVPPGSRDECGHRGEARSARHSGHRGQLLRGRDARSTRSTTRAAGRMAGEALGDFAARNWRAQNKLVAVVGPLGAQADGHPRAGAGGDGGPQATASGHAGADARHARATRRRSDLSSASSCPPTPRRKILIAAMDDQTALAAKAALESAGRLQDGAIVSHGVDRSMHGGMNERKEIDPNNRGSIVIGSVAFYLDRAGYAMLPLALPDAAGADASRAHDGRPSAGHGGERLRRVSALRHEVRLPATRDQRDGVAR